MEVPTIEPQIARQNKKGRAPSVKKSPEGKNRLLKEKVHTNDQGEKIKVTHRLSKEGREQIRAQWESEIIGGQDPSSVSLSDVREKTAAAIDRLKREHSVATDEDSKRLLHLQVLSYRKHLERVQSVHVRAQMEASNSPWRPVKDLLQVKGYEHVGRRVSARGTEKQHLAGEQAVQIGGKFAESAATNYIAKMKAKIDSGVEQAVAMGMVTRADFDRAVVSYDQKISTKLFEALAAVPKDVLEREGVTKVLARTFGTKGVEKFIITDMEATNEQQRLRVVREAMIREQQAQAAAEQARIQQQAQEREARVQERQRIQRAEELGRQQQEAERLREQQRLEAVVQRQRIVHEANVPERLRQEASRQKNTPFMQRVRRHMPQNLRHAAVNLVLIGGLFLGGRAGVDIAQNAQVAHSPQAISIQVDRPQPAPVVDAMHNFQVPTSPMLVVPGARPAFAEQVLPIHKENKTELKVGQQPSLIKESSVQQSSPKVEIPPRSEKKLKDNRIGFRINDVTAIDYTNDLGTDFIRIAGNGTRVESNGKLEGNLSELLDAADKQGKSVSFVFNPNIIPSYEEKGSMPENIEEIKRNEGVVKAEMKKRLSAVLMHPSVDSVILGNEFTDHENFWKGDTNQFAYFTKLGIDVIRELDPKGNVNIILAPLPTPSEHQKDFVEFMNRLKDMGVNVKGMQMGVNAYSVDEVETGIAMVKGAGGIPIITETGVDLNAPQAAEKMNKLLQLGLRETSGPIYVHQLRGKNEGQFIDLLGNNISFDINYTNGDVLTALSNRAKTPEAKIASPILAQGANLQQKT